MRQGLAVLEGQDATQLPNGGIIFDLLHEEAEFDLGSMRVPDEETWHGREGVINGWMRWLSQWDEYRFTGSNLEEQGNHVLVDIHAEALGRGSRVPVSIDHTQIWTWRGEKVDRIEVFADRAAASRSLSPAAPDAADAARTPPAP